MLFNSATFILAFLPLTIAAYYALSSRRDRRLDVLCLASIVFYGWWDWRLVPLLVGSVTANWTLVRLFARHGHRGLLAAGIVLNLALIAIFKYADFLVGSAFHVVGDVHEPFDIVLPLGISFFTFQQISYLADVRRGARADYRFRDYLLYVTYFPQLIAGPIVRHDEIIHQFDLDPRRSGMWERMTRGACLFLIGLAKKVLLADGAGEVVNHLFAEVRAGVALGAVDAWTAAGGFALQVYFDFSGYSDMAIGLGLLCGFALPLNFNAPYRATSIAEFWRRWHMTLSRFLRDYLFISLGGSRRGRSRQVFALCAVMVLGGLWHGAAWTFVLFGVVHGVALAVHTLWRRVGVALPGVVGWALTFMVHFSALSIFRADSTASAGRILNSLVGFDGLGHASVALHWALPIGAVIALVGPTSQQVALERLQPRRGLALAMGFALLLLLLWMGGNFDNEFIYFQF